MGKGRAKVTQRLRKGHAKVKRRLMKEARGVDMQFKGCKGQVGSVIENEGSHAEKQRLISSK